MYYSFDVFDTCLTRIYTRPTDLFYELGNKLLAESCVNGYDEISVNLFVKLRKQSEKEVRNLSRGCIEDITLYNIYLHFQTISPWPIDIEQSMYLEMELEQKALCVVQEIYLKIKRLRKEGHDIIFISDMYLPTEFIKSCLIGNGIAIQGDSVYVSGDIGLSKRTGNLYSKILELEGIQAKQLIHCGDNYYSDIIKAQSHGIHTIYFKDAQLSFYQLCSIRGIQKKYTATFSKLIGASRLARLESTIDNQKTKVLSNLASDVIAPLLTAFVAWVLQDAKQKGISRLYFVARDGQILYKIAQKLTDGQKNMPECRYLYGSRQAWLAPSINKPNWEQFNWLTEGPISKLIDLLYRLEFAPENVYIYLKKYKLDCYLNHEVKGVVLERFKCFVLDPDVFYLLQEKIKFLRHNVVGYLSQEGIFDDVRWALVDLGWMLNCQHALSKIIKATGHDIVIEGYYFGIRHNAIKKEEAGLRYGFITQNQSNAYISTSCSWLFRSNAHVIIEDVFTPAEHETTLSYQQHENYFSPVFAGNHSHLAQIIHCSVLSYVSFLNKQDLFDLLDSYSIAAIDNTKKFFTKPDRYYIQGLSELKVNRNPSHKIQYERQIASRMDFKEILTIIFLGRYQKEKHVWLEASAILSSPLNRLLLQSVLLIRNIGLVLKWKFKAYSIKK